MTGIAFLGGMALGFIAGVATGAWLVGLLGIMDRIEREKLS